MKKISNFLILALLAIGMGLTSCVETDNPFSDATDSYPYTRMGQAIRFNEDGTGYGVTFFFNNEEGDPVAIIGGKDMAPRNQGDRSLIQAWIKDLSP